MTVRVRHCGILKLQYVKDMPDGNLFIAESLNQIPFEIRRVFFINSLANPKATRGKHAHKTLQQAIFCISGSFVLHLDDGFNKQKITLKDPSCGIWLGPGLWHTMTSCSYNCVILVLASAPYDEADYIRDYDSFLESVRGRDGANKSDFMHRSIPEIRAV